MLLLLLLFWCVNAVADCRALAWFQPSRLTSLYAGEQIREDVELMAATDFDGVIFQWTMKMSGDEVKAYGPLVNDYLNILSQNKMSIILGGLYFSPWYKLLAINPNYMDYRSRRVFHDLNAEFGSRVDAWYIPVEISSDAIHDRKLLEYFSRLSMYLKNISQKPIYVSYYFSKRYESWDIGAISQWLVFFLKVPMVDGVYLQSGYGKGIVLSVPAIRYDKALRSFAADFSVEVSPVVETFARNYAPLRHDFVRMQYQKMSHSHTISVFDFSHYLKPMVRDNDWFRHELKGFNASCGKH